MSLSGLLQVSRDALSSYQTAMGVTGGNIANVNTPGYTRQRVVFNAVGTVQAQSVDTQMSVEVSQVERVMSNFLETQLVGQYQNVGYSETENNMLQRVETIFDETSGTGLSDTLGRFWGSWEDLTLEPQGQVERDAVLSAAQDLVENFNYIAGELENIESDATSAMTDTVSQINNIINEIAGLNKVISESGADDGTENQLMDKQMESLKSLGNLIDFNYIGNADGTIDVFLPDGNLLLSGNIAKQLSMDGDQVVFANSTDSLNDTISTNKKGVLGALIDMRDTVIPGYIDKLDALAKEIVEQVNTQHNLGYDNNSERGLDFFDPENITGKSISVSSVIEGDLDKIAASDSATASGSGANALKIAGLKDGSHTNLLGSTANVTKDAVPVAITADTAWNNIAGTVAVDTVFNISGKTHDGTAATGGTYKVANVATETVQDLLDAIEAAYDGKVTATIDANGKLQITDDTTGDSQLTLTLTTTAPAGALSFGTNPISASVEGSDTTFGSYYSSMVAQIGRDIADAQRNSEHHSAVLQQLGNQRESMSGVSIDEEMMDLIRYQMGYNAAGRLCQTVNELMDTLMNLGR